MFTERRVLVRWAVLLGLGATAAFGWTWLDPVIGLLLAGWAIYEGIEVWQRQGCC